MQSQAGPYSSDRGRIRAERSAAECSARQGNVRVHIDAPPEAVWTLVADLERMGGLDGSEDGTSWENRNDALDGLDVVWVGIRCSAEVAEERNRTRGERFAGLARALTATVHRYARYAFEVDTTTATQDEALSQLTRRLGY